MKMTMKKKLLTTLSVVLILGMAALGILAYLTSEDSDVNVMTLGNVEIEQIEQERAANGGLQDFTGNDEDEEPKPLYPAVYNEITWDDTNLDVNGVGYKVFDSDMKNVQDKIVTVKNAGATDAYVRTLVAFEAPEGFNDELLHLNYNSTDVAIGDWKYITVGEERYVINVFTYNDAVKAKTISAPSLMQVFLNKAATNEDMELLGDEYKILVLSQAVQTAGFESAQAALDEGFGEVTEENAAMWFSKLFAPTAVNSEEAIMTALAEAKDGDVINVAGGTYDFTETDIVIEKAITLQAADADNKPVFKVNAGDGTGSSSAINNGIEIKSNNVTLSNLKLVVGAGGSGNLVQISPNGTDFYSDITIDGCEFSGADHCIAMYGNNVTIKNCILDESNANSQGNIIYVWGTSGKLTIQDNVFIGKEQRKHAISLYRQSEASKISGEILINGNTFTDVYKGVVHESNMTYENVSVTISNNVFTNYKKKAVGIDNGSFTSYVVTGNVFEANSDPCVIDNKVNATVNANGNYWGYETPDWGKVIEGNNVIVDNYYTDSAKTNLVSK